MKSYFCLYIDFEQVKCHILAPPLSWSLLEAVALSWGSPLAMLKTVRRQSCEECTEDACLVLATLPLSFPHFRQRARLPSPFRSVLGLRSLNTHRPRYPNRGVRTEDLRSSLLSAFSLVQRNGLCPKRQPRLLIS